MDGHLLKAKRVVLDLPGAVANLRRQGRPRRVFGFEHGLEPGIKTAPDFDAYPWPALAQVNLADLEWCEQHLPENLAVWRIWSARYRSTPSTRPRT
jgi:hypothetical protein